MKLGRANNNYNRYQNTYIHTFPRSSPLPQLSKGACIKEKVVGFQSARINDHVMVAISFPNNFYDMNVRKKETCGGGPAHEDCVWSD